ncbi:T-cell surface glycoprotein CD3 delta chain isoform X2 [Physeter macrocephalus]|uniref:T-cell surface glycoprotein CD3 delta chain n=1 Tax=Physeter macrocephalus TaxID=9755 RepID=A0A2Y9FJC0_PHYMC|nr:T-cell surface glycoprotein CD3 delta chain isoform X2 [Physeter catodon]|eukprot:XP_007124219.1 T-cell surface glycoprotein CD3 delta chain isoform X2 [Physeter catodon]
MEHRSFLSGLILAALLSQVSPFSVSVEELEDRVFLRCNTSIMWLEGMVGQLALGNKTMDLGKRNLDPRGVYVCSATDGQTSKTPTLQVYYRTADTQALLGNDQLYQPLRDRNEAQYSRLGENWARNK